MFNPIALSPEHEKDAEILNKLTRDRYSKLEQSDEWKRRGSLQDGEYSLTRLLHGMADGSTAATAPYEASCSARIAKAVGREPEPGYFFVPFSRRDLTVSGNGQLVASDVGPGNMFVSFLDSFFPFDRLGITKLSLERPCTIPGASGNVSTTWLANEASSISESDFVFSTQTSTPKSIGAYCEVSDRFLKQGSTFAQNFVLRSLARAVAAELSRKLLVGTGLNGQITGIHNHAGVSSLPGGSANFSKVLDAIGAVENASAMLNIQAAGFVAPPAVSKLLRARERASGSGMIQLANDCSGYNIITTAGASPNSLVFGDWSQLVLLDYSVLQISRDPYGASGQLFKAGLVGLRCMWMCDSILLNPPSFVTTGALN